MSDPLRIVLFDCDGTLADSQAVIVNAAATAFRQLALPEPSPGQVRRQVGRALPEALAALSAELGLTLGQHQFERLVAAFRAAYTDGRQQAGGAEPLFPGVAECVATLDDRGYLLGIVTGKSRTGLDHFLAGHAVGPRFLVTRSADDGPGKPRPEPVRNAVADLGGEPAWTAVIGDTSYDMAMAAGAGAQPIGVAWGNHDAATLHSHGARTVVADTRALVEAVAAAIGRPGDGGEAA